MTFFSLAEIELDALGLFAAIEDPVRGTLTLRFQDREEVWTLAPAGYPIDGSVAIVRLQGRIYAAPPTGRPA